MIRIPDRLVRYHGCYETRLTQQLNANASASHFGTSDVHPHRLRQPYCFANYHTVSRYGTLRKLGNLPIKIGEGAFEHLTVGSIGR